MKKITLYGLVVALAMLGVANVASASSFTVGFTNISNGSGQAPDVAQQLLATTSDSGDALSIFGLSLATNQVLFTFRNLVGIGSNVHEIYFDDSDPSSIALPQSIKNSLGGFTNYIEDTSPNQLPGQNNAIPSFVTTTAFGADIGNGGLDAGLNANVDIVGIVMSYATGATFTTLQNAILGGSFRFGLHVASIGSSGGSDSFVNTNILVPNPDPVPVPAAVWLFGSGLAGLIVSARRKSKTAIQA